MIAVDGAPTGENLDLAADLDRELHLQNRVAGFYCVRDTGVQIHDSNGTVNHKVNTFMKTRFILDLGHNESFSGLRF